jgi:hypothetical protein
MLVSTAMNWQKFVNIGLKMTMAVLIFHAAIYPYLPQYQEKGMKYRIIGYPLAGFAVYVLSKLGNKKTSEYPFNLDILITSVIVLDMLGNALGFYGSIEWWDDAMHLTNCALLTPVVMSFQSKKLQQNYLVLALNTIGFVAWLQVLWEVAEYITFITTNSRELSTAYRDTIGDLVFGQIGSICVIISLLKLKQKGRFKDE